MDVQEWAKIYSEIDAPDQWSKHYPTIDAKTRADAWRLALPLWIERQAIQGNLYLHPEVLAQLKEQSWVPNDLQKRMIWASVLASAEGADSKERFRNIKSLLLKKHGRDWWEDVYRRKTNAWAARERIRKQCGGESVAMAMLIEKTSLFRQAAAKEWNAALRMIPKT